MNPSRRSRTALRVVAAAALFVALTATSAWARERPTGRYVSTSGVPHTDVGGLRGAPGWTPASRPGITPSWRRALDTVIGQIAAERPDAVLHTGDMVEGRWDVDASGSAMFGPVETRAQRRAAVRRAGDHYYPRMRRWWQRHGLTVYAGLGDHEVGDMSHVGVLRSHRFKAQELDVWKRTWARHMARDATGGPRFRMRPVGTQFERTAYATRLGDVGLVTLDPFMRRHDVVRVRIGARQLQWLDRVLRRLRRTGARHLIVQSEIPALGPNRRFASSGLLLDDGRRLWRMLRAHDVDLLLSGEYHAPTTHSDRGTAPVQVVHGGRMVNARVSYLVITTFKDRIQVRLKEMGGRVGGGRLWSSWHAHVPARITMGQYAVVDGTLTIDADGRLSHRSGYLREGIRAREPRLRPTVERMGPGRRTASIRAGGDAR
ncbi:MAG TPA: metallophosphoesterase [Euzebyales bacterium]|nr:metallophosphoesterase [Euzebyales bacterium]